MDKTLSSILILSPFIFVKILILLCLLFYLVFAWVTLRQVEMMIRALDGSVNPYLRLLAVIHLGGSLLLFITALIIL